uniref:Uncharacterized protein n=1 Tax=Oryza meridionalis TaxID=40149 RepID=A0A0E0EYN6_9ORYZ
MQGHAEQLVIPFSCVAWSPCLELDKEESTMRTEIARPTVVQMLNLFNKNKSPMPDLPGLFGHWGPSTSISRKDALEPGDHHCQYIPFYGRAVHVEEDDTIYFSRVPAIRDATEVHVEEDDTIYFSRGYEFLREEMQLKPPVKIAEKLFPYGDDGSSFIARLNDSILCLVWVTTGLACGCTNPHILVATVCVNGESHCPPGL